MKDGVVHMWCFEKVVAEFLTWHRGSRTTANGIFPNIWFVHMEILERMSVEAIRKEDSEAAHWGRINVQIQFLT